MENHLASGVLCAVPTCMSSRRTHPTRKFYSFPLDKELFEIWLEKCSLKEAKKLPKKLILCEIHFDPMFKGKNKLLKNAIPIYYLTYPDVKIDNEPQSNQIRSPADSGDPFRSQTITDIIPIIPAEPGCNKTAEYIPIHLIDNGDALQNTNDTNSFPEEIRLLREKYIKSFPPINILTNKLKKFEKIINYYKEHINFLMSEIEKYKMNVALSKQVESLPNLSSAAKEFGLTILNDSTKDWLCKNCRANIDMALKSKETVDLDIIKLENNITSSCFEINEEPINKVSENVHIDDSAKCASFPSEQLKESSINLNSVVTNSEHDEKEQVAAEPLLSDGLKYECEKCEEKHETYRQLIYHMRFHTDLCLYECERCGKEFHMGSKYRSHARIYKTERSFICNICQKGFKRQPDLYQHGYAHKTKKILPCPHCDKSFCHRKSLSQHLSNYREKLILCHMCDKKFLYNSQLKMHMELTHKIGIQNDKRVKSDILRKQVSCSICAKLFTNKQCLKIHAKYVHNQIRPFSCTECEKRFPTSSGLKLHFQRHINSKTSSLDSETLKSYLKYKCDECDKAYTSPLYLKNHKIIHSGAKDHVCPDCGKGFAFKVYLKKYKRLVHETAHPSNFLCNICGKVSANVHALNAHMLSHTGEMPFHCKFCDSKFRYAKSLRLHVRNKHGN